MKYKIEYPEFKVQRRWYLWVTAIFFNLLALRFGFTKNYFMLVVILIIDVVLLPDASHFRYVINDKFISVKCIIYPGWEIPLSMITAVENESLMAFKGLGLRMIESSPSAYRIKYMEGRREKTIILSPKDRENFIIELSSRIDKNLILVNNTESAFKRRKDKK